MKDDGQQRDLSAIPAWKKALFAIVPAALIFGGIEVALRIVGFEFHGIPRHLQFGPNLAHDITRNAAVPDDTLFWRVRVDEKNAPTLARHKLVHPELRALTGADRRDPSRLRVVTMGDSCTFFGSPSYPRRVEELLELRGLDAEVFNASQPGFSSFQGRVWFESEITGYSPDWITVYYGWNDHWLATRFPDHRLGSSGRTASRLLDPLLRRVRLAQAGVWVWTRLTMPAPGERPLRVPPEEYRKNLGAICGAARDAGIRVLMLTAPAELNADDLARLRADGAYVADTAEVPRLHERYNEVVREVAAECGAAVIDAAAEDVAAARLVSEDGIHLSQRGIEWLAARITEVVAEGAGTSPAPAN